MSAPSLLVSSLSGEIRSNSYGNCASQACAVPVCLVTRRQLIVLPCRLQTCFSVFLVLWYFESQLIERLDLDVFRRGFSCFNLWVCTALLLNFARCVVNCVACLRRMSDTSESVAGAMKNLKALKVCSHFHASYDTHDMCPSCRQKEGWPVCTRDDNCKFCLGCDDVFWDLYEKNLARKERKKQKKIEKLQRSQSVSEWRDQSVRFSRVWW